MNLRATTIFFNLIHPISGICLKGKREREREVISCFGKHQTFVEIKRQNTWGVGLGLNAHTLLGRTIMGSTNDGKAGREG